MNDDSAKKAYRAEKIAQIRARSRILTDTRAEILRLLDLARDRILLQLAGAGEGTSLVLAQLKREVEQAMAQFGRDAAARVGTAAGMAWAAGQALVEAPLTAGGFRLAGLLPVLDTRQLEAMRSFATDRIKDVGVQAANRINQELGLTMLGAQPMSQTVTAVKTILREQSRDRAITIVRTEISRAYAVAADGRLRQAAQVVPGMKKQWRRSGKLHSRLSHDLADGQIRPVDEAFVIYGLRGPVKLMFPHDPKAPASEVINCGCTALPFKDGWDMASPGKKRFTAAEMAANPRKADIQQALDEGKSVADVLAGGRAA
jgi:hypothetical protein